MFGFGKKYKGLATPVEMPKKGVGDSLENGTGQWSETNTVELCDFGDAVLNEAVINHGILNNLNCPVFLGYPTLSELAQRTEIRLACEDSVNEVFRSGFKIKSNGDEDRKDIIKKLEADFELFGVEKHMKVVGFNAEAFGNSYLAVRFKNDEKELSSELILDKIKIRKGDLLGFRPVEPIWISPVEYNASDPLADDFYKPTRWVVSGDIANGFADGYGISSSRLKQLVLYKVPDIYKPDFFFGGLSLSQMMLPYVNNFISVRDDIPKIIRTFRTQIWKTDMSRILQSKGAFNERLNAFAYSRDNHGVLAIDNNADEELMQINTSLSGLNELQDSILKLICVPSRLSVTFLTGDQPKGLNSTGDGERVAQHEHLAGKQQTSYKPIMDWILKIICLNAFGEVYEDLYIDFNPLEEMSDHELAELNAKNIESYVKLIENEVVTPEQVHSVISSDEKNPFNGTEYENILDAGEGYDDEISEKDETQSKDNT